jgi:cytochrome c-type biogenesis protein CcmH
MKRISLVLSTLLLLTLLLASPALAQDSGPGGVTDDDVNAIAKQLYCPVCENIPLDVCGTQACAQWRDLIRLKLSEGQSEAQIKQYFVDQYGDRVLATPPARGLNWLVYIVPPVVILIGAVVLYRAFQMWKRPAPAATPAAPPGAGAKPAETDEYLRRLEEELRKR